MDVGAKTGSTNNYYDKWLCGFTNYYTAATWYGYDENEEIKGETNWAGQIWSAVMKKVHSGLDGSKFDKPEGIVSAKICKDSGKRATDKCTNTYSEIFVEGTVPESCDAHTNSAEVCDDTGLLANEYCPHVSTQYFSYTVEKEELGLWKNKTQTAKNPPTTYCSEHTLQNTTKEVKATTIDIIGEKEITLTVGDTYTEKGATAKDEIDGDITNKIEISGSVNTSKAGTYEITYKVKNSKQKETTVKRKITVKEKEKPKPAENTTTNTQATNINTNTIDNTTDNNTTNPGNATDTSSKENKTEN